MDRNYELLPEQLRRTFDTETLGIETTERLEPAQEIVRQERAVSALRFGLSVEGDGFNIYVAGPPGIGKMTAVQAFLEDLARRKNTPSDWCYVNNFDDPYHPRALKFPPGRGREFQQDMKALIDHVRRELPKAFESEAYANKRDEIIKDVNRRRESVLERLNTRATQAGFTLQTSAYGLMMVPVLGGRPLTEAEVLALPPAAREDLQQRRDALQGEMDAEMKVAREVERAALEKMRELDRQVTLYIVGGLIDRLSGKYQNWPEISAYLKSVQKDILENIAPFRSGASTPAGPGNEPSSPPVLWSQDLPFRKYEVNVFVENGQLQGAPVIVELNPSYNNLFGRIEKETQMGALYTDFTMLKAGSLHRANGGYLVLPVEDVLGNLFSWDGLKRALRSHELQVEELGERLGYVAVKSLRPQPIPLQLKVLLVGRPLLYYLLQAYDEGFPELFKVKADFDTRMARTPENIKQFLAVLCGFCHKEKLLPLDRRGIASVLEHASRLAEDQEKLSSHFGVLADLIREAHYWALQESASQISAVHVQKALDQKVYRSNLIEEHVREMISRGTLLIETTGELTGQVNALSVVQLHDYLFGKPSRITASVGPGREGVIDIEREVELGGPLHSKGVLILSGYLSQKYARDFPLTLAARLVFEQSYEGVEGDSASSTELYAILSALADLPLKQGIAVTGSVNQHGEVQAIGGVNQKIEGFFDLCRVKGLTGEQGVLIPLSNLQNLMLREDVVDAVRSKMFHIWAVKTIDQGIEVLTGMPAGERGSHGQFQNRSVNYRAEERLREFADCLKGYPELTGTLARS